MSGNSGGCKGALRDWIEETTRRTYGRTRRRRGKRAKRGINANVTGEIPESRVNERPGLLLRRQRQREKRGQDREREREKERAREKKSMRSTRINGAPLKIRLAPSIASCRGKILAQGFGTPAAAVAAAFVGCWGKLMPEY